MFRDSAVDVLVLVFMTTFLLSQGYTLVLKEYKNTMEYSSEILEEKNLQMVEGVLLPAYGDFNGTLTTGQVVLMSQVQDYNAPKHQDGTTDEENSMLIKVEDKDGNSISSESGAEGIRIVSTIDAEKEYYGTQIISMMKAIGAGETTKFSINYDNGTDFSTDVDDSWLISQITNANVEK